MWIAVLNCLATLLLSSIAWEDEAMLDVKYGPQMALLPDFYASRVTYLAMVKLGGINT